MKRGGTAAVVLGAIGVVFGDIGTSPLYTLRTVFAPEHGLDPGREQVYGVVSLIFWAITLIVSVKYVTFIMRADNDGEGGIMALIALIQRANLRSRGAQITLVLLGVFGASLFYGDGMITPAISVLSAVEGLEVVDEDLEQFVIPITIAVLTALFASQRFGTARVGVLLRPGDDPVVQRAGDLRLRPHARAPRDPAGAVAAPRRRVPLQPRARGVRRARRRRARGHRRGGPVRRHGALRASAIRRGWFALVFPALILNEIGVAYPLARTCTTPPPLCRSPLATGYPDIDRDWWLIVESFRRSEGGGTRTSAVGFRVAWESASPQSPPSSCGSRGNEHARRGGMPAQLR